MCLFECWAPVRSDRAAAARTARRPAFAVWFDVVAGRCLAKTVRQPFLELFEARQVLNIECPSWQLSDVLSLDRNPLVVRKGLAFAGPGLSNPVVNSADQGDASEVRPRGRVRLAE